MNDRPACSGGATGANCERLNTGTCDGTAYFAHLSKTAPAEPQRAGLDANESDGRRQAPLVHPSAVERGVYVGAIAHDYWFDTLDGLEVMFRCEAGTCAAARLQIGAVKRIELDALDGRKPHRRDVGRQGSAGSSASRSDRCCSQGGARRIRAPSTRFARSPSASPSLPQRVEWTIPVFASPSSDGTPLGTIVIRLLPATNALEFVYQPKSGKGIPFEPDWAQPDWGYTYSMEQTVLDRKGDWFQLPARPFPGPVWVHLPGREKIFSVERGTVYTLSKTVKARTKEANKPTVFRGGELLVIGVNGRTLEFRQEEEFDSVCSDAYDPARSVRQPTYLADVEEFYDGDLHLQLRPAYPKGC